MTGATLPLQLFLDDRFTRHEVPRLAGRAGPPAIQCPYPHAVVPTQHDAIADVETRGDQSRLYLALLDPRSVALHLC